jgi:hypothetical protein
MLPTAGLSTPLTIKEAVDWIEERTGVRKSYPTLFRWMQKGVGGHRLRFERCGGTRHITPEALVEFLEAHSSQQRTPGQQMPPIPKKMNPRWSTISANRRRQIAANEEHLRRTLGRNQSSAQ